MFFMFSFLISASCRWCNWKFACSYIADLSHCLREFSLVALSVPLFFCSSRRWRSSIYSLTWADYLRACTRERNPRDDHLILLRDDHRYVLSVHGMQTCAEASFGRLSRFFFSSRGFSREKFSLCNFARLAEVA